VTLNRLKQVEHTSRRRSASVGAKEHPEEARLLLDPLLPLPHEDLGRLREFDFREIINPILYLNRTGYQWEMQPHDLPPISTTYGYFAQWQDDGTWATHSRPSWDLEVVFRPPCVRDSLGQLFTERQPRIEGHLLPTV